mgnify:FL=1
MVNAEGAALHNKMLLSMSKDSAPKKQDKQHLGLRSRHMSFHIDKRLGHSQGMNLYNRVELPFRKSDGDCMLMKRERKEI